MRNRASAAFRRSLEFLNLAEIRQCEDRHGDRDVSGFLGEKFSVIRLVKDLFVIHEGTKVTILDEVGSWRNISLADGRQGWIPASDIEII